MAIAPITTSPACETPTFSRDIAISRCQEILNELGLQYQNYDRCGSFCRIYYYFNPESEKEEAIKLVHGRGVEESQWRYACKEMAREVHALAKIHLTGKNKNIIPMPKEVYFANGSSKIIGLRTRWYANDIYALTARIMPELEVKYALPILRTCLAPIARFHAQNTVLGDVKSENILFNHNGEIALCDLASVCAKGDITLSRDPHYMLGTHTADFMCWDDVFELVRIASRLDLGPGREEELLETLWGLRLSMDLFAFGVLMLNLVTGWNFGLKLEERDTLIGNKRHHIHACNSTELTLRFSEVQTQFNIPDSLSRLIQETTDVDYRRRPSASEILKRIDAIGKDFGLWKTTGEDCDCKEAIEWYLNLPELSESGSNSFSTSYSSST